MYKCHPLPGTDEEFDKVLAAYLLLALNQKRSVHGAYEEHLVAEPLPLPSLAILHKVLTTPTLLTDIHVKGIDEAEVCTRVVMSLTRTMKSKYRYEAEDDDYPVTAHVYEVATYREFMNSDPDNEDYVSGMPTCAAHDLPEPKHVGIRVADLCRILSLFDNTPINGARFDDIMRFVKFEPEAARAILMSSEYEGSDFSDISDRLRAHLHNKVRVVGAAVGLVGHRRLAHLRAYT